MRALLRNIFLIIAGSFKRPKPGIHIINSHFITPYEKDTERDNRIYDNYLSYLQKYAKFITLEEATNRILSNSIPNNEVLLTFTFDDGFEEGYSIIAPLLEKYNTRGTFFINANYIESGETYQQEFNKRVNTFTKKPMTWEQLKDLHERGHLIGSHNLDHSNFAEIGDDDISFQISKNKKILEEKLSYECHYFAWTYGQIKHFPIKALELTQKYHNYIYSDTNFKHYFSLNNKVINRRHIEPFWPKSHINYFLGVRKKK
jgi:peptidoglycan/xylan/chitin deacetylase (PgdA/CDA1 family)